MSARPASHRWLATLLALAMLCAQALALRHATQHQLDAAAAALSADAGNRSGGGSHGLGGADACLKCQAVQQLASALPCADFAFEAAPPPSQPIAASPTRVERHARIGPPARGPPIFS